MNFHQRQMAAGRIGVPSGSALAAFIGANALSRARVWPSGAAPELRGVEAAAGDRIVPAPLRPVRRGWLSPGQRVPPPPPPNRPVELDELFTTV